MDSCESWETQVPKGSQIPQENSLSLFFIITIDFLHFETGEHTEISLHKESAPTTYDYPPAQFAER